ncbi:MAG: ATP-binding cassette domain-containing protein [Clostridia bacterium]|nr:ATP-binding cassette domain-containing protein [Clostridia bacterium]
MKDVIQIKNLYKSYGDVKAVQDLSFKVKEGELFAFLGVNGAGKSTTISIMCSALQKDSGTVIINGNDIDKESDDIKRALGVVFQNSVLDKSLTVYDNLRSRAAVYGIHGNDFKTRLDELSELLDFKPLLKRTVGKLSGGQKRKIDVARALIHKPRILVLDEPTTGLDPQTRLTLWSVIENLRKTEKMTVFLTTHYMEEAADADFVVIIDSGKIVAEGTPLQLKNEYAGDSITIYGIDDATANSLGISYEKISGAHRFSVKNTAQATELITKYPHIFVDYEVVKGKMDSVFLTVTGKKLEGGDNK